MYPNSTEKDFIMDDPKIKLCPHCYSPTEKGNPIHLHLYCTHPPLATIRHKANTAIEEVLHLIYLLCNHAPNKPKINPFMRAIQKTLAK